LTYPSFAPAAGHIFLQIAKAVEAWSLVMIGLMRDENVRWKLAGRFGTDAAVGVEKEDLVEVVKKMTKGIGADMAVEYKGLPPCNP
jgi:NADPH:quinone reductase-like Zn-dependent oxidoreductase